MADHVHALPEGFQLENYELRRVLSTGPYGIKYVATDHDSGQAVAVKEYFPVGVAVRQEGTGVVPKSSSDSANFEAGLTRFLDVAKAQTRLRHDNLVRTHGCLNAGGTGYVVMDYIEGKTLAEVVAQRDTLPEDELLRVVHPILDALAKIHSAGYLHHEIRPGTIILRPDGSPVLLDFSGGRRSAGGARQAFANRPTHTNQFVTQTPGYTPLEQYSPNSNLGPWTDIYSFGAVLYRCVAGHTPQDAPARIVMDEYVPVSKSAAGKYRKATLAAIDMALAIAAPQRPSTVSAWRARFSETGRAPSRPRAGARGSPRMSTRGASSRTAGTPVSRQRRTARWLVPVGGALGFVGALTWLDIGVLPEGERPAMPNVVIGGIPTDPSSLAIVTTPPGVEVLLDGDLAGETPLDMENLKAGYVNVTLRHPLYETVELQAQRLSPGAVTNIEQTLTRSTGAIEIATTPPGAWIVYDGSRLPDTTPTTIEDLPTGPVTLMVGAEGFKSREVRAEVARLETSTLNVQLDSSILYGTLTVDVTPPDAVITLPDIDPAYSPGLRLPEGEYRVRATRAGYSTETRVVNVAGDVNATFRLTVDPQPFTISVTPPAQLEFVASQRRYAPGMRLPPGDYRLRAVLVGHRTWEEVIRHGTAPTNRSVALQEGIAEFADTMNNGSPAPTMVLVPAGGFQMGCVSGTACRRNEQPVHAVSFAAPFAVSKYEVTFDQFSEFTDTTGRSAAVTPRGWQRANHPVVNVSWEDANAYAQWLSAQTNRRYRLPSEAEWEYAARGGSTTAYSWGGNVGNGLANCNGCGSTWDNDSTAPIGMFAANPWGLHDMHGNVWEWLADCRNDNYNGAPSDGAARVTGDCLRRILRGGSWSSSPANVRVARREWDDASLRTNEIGFRVVAEATPATP